MLKAKEWCTRVQEGVTQVLRLDDDDEPHSKPGKYQDVWEYFPKYMVKAGAINNLFSDRGLLSASDTTHLVCYGLTALAKLVLYFFSPFLPEQVLKAIRCLIVVMRAATLLVFVMVALRMITDEITPAIVDAGFTAAINVLFRIGFCANHVYLSLWLGELSPKQWDDKLKSMDQQDAADFVRAACGCRFEVHGTVCKYIVGSSAVLVGCNGLLAAKLNRHALVRRRDLQRAAAPAA